MNYEICLITLFLTICKYYQEELWIHCERFSNNNHPDFSDEEVMVIYLFGIIRKRRNVKDIYEYIQDHFSAWFPHLPSYEAYLQRLNRLSAVFPALVEKLKADYPKLEILTKVRLLDSMPIIIAKQKRSSKAKVANEYANKGYCASKGIYFYGVRLHALAIQRKGRLPLPEQLFLTPAAINDLIVLEQILQSLINLELYADKAYVKYLLDEILKLQQNLTVYTPIKKKKGQECLDLFDKLFSTAVSRVRQPIESFFNWLEEKTGIQVASKVRSFNGLMVHVFGRLAAALFILIFNS